MCYVCDCVSHYLDDREEYFLLLNQRRDNDRARLLRKKMNFYECCLNHRGISNFGSYRADRREQQRVAVLESVWGLIDAFVEAHVWYWDY